MSILHGNVLVHSLYSAGHFDLDERNADIYGWKVDTHVEKFAWLVHRWQFQLHSDLSFDY